MVYFNEHDRFASAWLRTLFPAAEVDDRSIVDVNASEISQYTRAHFFGGIGGWEYALYLAAWPCDWPVWTGSCPCQPFSCAGTGQGKADPRHLWPEFRRLIAAAKPATIFGEQVASKAGRDWLNGVLADMEALGYRTAAADLCSAGVGAPHIRQRLYWVADSGCTERGRRPGDDGRSGELLHFANRSSIGRLADAASLSGPKQRCESGRRRKAGPEHSAKCAGSSGMVDSNDTGCAQHGGPIAIPSPLAGAQLPSLVGHWDRYDTIKCLDGKTRRIESGSFPLADGVPSRVGRLRGYGNAITPQVAAVFVRSFLDTLQR